jgi:hypothetical protein
MVVSITWEALEHLGPGSYDEAHLAQLRKTLLEAEKQGISVIIEPRMDAWSRWTGGEGAPAWTLEKLGFDLEGLAGEAAGAAKAYGAATLFTLFFAGNTYAPDLTVDGEKIQDWLQGRYIACFRHCFRRLKNCKAIIGWEAMSNPQPGFIGCRDLSAPPAGQTPSPWQTMVSGYPPFKPGFSCPWKQAGVWTGEGEEARILKKDYFALFDGRPVNFAEDFLEPFRERFFGSGIPSLGEDV